jgi:hypothetical protein
MAYKIDRVGLRVSGLAETRSLSSQMGFVSVAYELMGIVGGSMWLTIPIFIYVFYSALFPALDKTADAAVKKGKDQEWTETNTVSEVLAYKLKHDKFQAQKGFFKNFSSSVLKVSDRSKIVSEQIQRKLQLSPTNSVVAISVSAANYSINFEDCALSMALAAHVFVIVQIEGTDPVNEQAAFLLLAQNLMAAKMPAIPRARILFCSSRIGRIALMRQLGATLVIETDTDIALEMAKHVRASLVMDSNPTPQVLQQVADSPHPVLLINSYSQVFDMNL